MVIIAVILFFKNFILHCLSFYFLKIDFNILTVNQIPWLCYRKKNRIICLVLTYTCLLFQGWGEVLAGYLGIFLSFGCSLLSFYFYQTVISAKKPQKAERGARRYCAEPLNSLASGRGPELTPNTFNRHCLKHKHNIVPHNKDV